MISEPLWVKSAEVGQLLSYLVDRLDSAEQRGSNKVQSVALTDKTWPSLYKAAFESTKEELWEHVAEMCRWGWLQVKPDSALRARSGYDHAPRVTVVDATVIRNAVGRPERVRSSVERWREAVNQGLVGTDSVKRTVGEYCIDMPDHDMAEVVQQLNRLSAFAEKPMLLREVSTQLFWGMSKVLDKRQGLVAGVLGLDECPFPESPIQLQVHLPAGGFSSILFIENLMSFEQATRSATGAFANRALVYASGFKGSAQRLRSRTGCSLYYSSKGALGGSVRDEFELWLFGTDGTQAQFWGDLDYSGLRILAAMRASFPGLTAWQPGYGPMLSDLLAGHGHTPEAAEKQGQRAIACTGCHYADNELIPALDKTGRYLDQELYTL